MFISENIFDSLTQSTNIRYESLEAVIFSVQAHGLHLSSCKSKFSMHLMHQISSTRSKSRDFWVFQIQNRHFLGLRLGLVDSQCTSNPF